MSSRAVSAIAFMFASGVVSGRPQAGARMSIPCLYAAAVSCFTFSRGMTPSAWVLTLPMTAFPVR